MGTFARNDVVVTLSNRRMNGITKYLEHSRTPIPIAGRLMTPAALLKLYQRSLATRDAVHAAQGAYKAALAARDATEAERQVVDVGLRSWVQNRFGEGSPEAAEFGFSPRKAPEITAEARMKAVRLNKATRIARRTLGKKARLKIKGELPTEAEPSILAAPEQAH
jgi:hypothetical protein